MGRTRTRGITAEADGTKTVNKEWRGRRIFKRGFASQEAAEQWLLGEIQRRQDELGGGGGTCPVFAVGAARYLREAEKRGVRSLDDLAWHVKLLLPHVGRLPLDQIHDETLEPFKEGRRQDGVSPTTINRSLEVVRTILNRAARAWRDEAGKPWLKIAPPLLTMEEESPQATKPLTWDEQDSLFPRLPPHLAVMALFAVNSGARDENVCGLRWKWEHPVPEVGRSVFVIPAAEFKSRRDHVLILNDVAWSIVEAQRGRHAEFVFAYQRPAGKTGKGTYEPHRVDTMNNTAWQRARREAGMPWAKVHCLRHTFATRLRAAEVSKEDRAALLGHAIDSMPEHYAAADVARLIRCGEVLILSLGSNKEKAKKIEVRPGVSCR